MFKKRVEPSFLTLKIFEICFTQTNLRKLVCKSKKPLSHLNSQIALAIFILISAI